MTIVYTLNDSIIRTMNRIPSFPVKKKKIVELGRAVTGRFGGWADRKYLPGC